MTVEIKSDRPADAVHALAQLKAETVMADAATPNGHPNTITVSTTMIVIIMTVDEAGVVVGRRVASESIVDARPAALAATI